MKPILGFLLIICFVGCGKDIPTGPQGHTLEVNTEEYNNGSLYVRFQFYWDGARKIKHGYYKEFDKDGQMKKEGNYKNGKKNGKWVSRGPTEGKPFVECWEMGELVDYGRTC